MSWKRGHELRKEIPLKIFVGFFALFLNASVLRAEDSADHPEKKSEVIESNIDLDEMTMPARAESKEKPAGASNEKASSSSDESSSNGGDVILTEQQMLRLSQNLKNAIEENKELLKEKEKIMNNFKELRGQREIESSRMNSITQEREELKKRLDEALKNSQDQTKKLQDVQSSLDQKTKEWEEKNKKLENDLALQEKWNKELEEMKNSLQAPPAQEAIQEANADTLEEKVKDCEPAAIKHFITKYNNLGQENERLKSETAKVHYNLGNMFFKQGEYKEAALEYSQAIQLMPYDAENHYNLALVSGEYLNDYKVALKHYEQYLFLRPNAKDAVFVKEKILKAKMELKSTINSPLNEDSKIPDNY